MKKYDYLNGTEIYLYQDQNFFKVNTDTILLGHFYKLYAHERILDIGTNNGALLLFKKDIKADFNAVEVLENALVIAQENFAYHHMSVQCFAADIRTFYEGAYDVIVCNPPYFKDDNYNSNLLLNTQRHNVHLNLSELFEAVNRLLKSNGRFYMVHRATALNDIYKEMNPYKMRVKTLQFIHDQQKQQAHAVLLEIVKSECIESTVLNPHHIER